MNRPAVLLGVLAVLASATLEGCAAGARGEGGPLRTSSREPRMVVDVDLWTGPRTALVPALGVHPPEDLNGRVWFDTTSRPAVEALELHGSADGLHRERLGAGHLALGERVGMDLEDVAGDAAGWNRMTCSVDRGEGVAWPVLSVELELWEAGLLDTTATFEGPVDRVLAACFTQPDRPAGGLCVLLVSALGQGLAERSPDRP